jgi:hypothetical protein
MSPLCTVPQTKHTHRLLVAGFISLALQACGGGGASDISPTMPGTTITGTLTASCSGIHCGAINGNQYNGVDVGLWHYNNTSTQDAYVNIDIAGVSGGQHVTLAFANGEKNDSSNTPLIGSNASKNVAPKRADRFDFKTAKATYFNTLSTKQQHRYTRQANHDAAHAQQAQANILSRQRAAASRLTTRKVSPAQAEALFKQSLAAQKPLATPALNSKRVWTNTFGYPQTTPVNHTTVNQFVCTLPGGRNLVFWQDTASTMAASTLKYFTDNSCGSSGTFARVNSLLGDFWGAHNRADLIKDTSTNKQTISIVFIDPGAKVDWAGYFSSADNAIPSDSSPSNQALVFFVNANKIDEDPEFYLSTLVHEATHMAAYYQNEVVRNKFWGDTWLDEIFAMMGEDIVVPAVTGYDKLLQGRLPLYMLSGANVSLNNWVDLSGDHYNMGGTFGAFLNRRYGLNIYQQLITGCTTSSTQTDAYACLNSLIINNGGTGITEELGKMGATLFSKASPYSALPGYGFSSKTSGGYTLQSVDLSTYELSLPYPALNYGSMSQTYLNDSVPMGITRYIRTAVRVPAHSRLDVVIQ